MLESSLDWQSHLGTAYLPASAADRTADLDGRARPKSEAVAYGLAEAHNLRWSEQEKLAILPWDTERMEGSCVEKR